MAIYYDPSERCNFEIDASTDIYLIRMTHHDNQPERDTYALRGTSLGLPQLKKDPASRKTTYWPIDIPVLLANQQNAERNALLFPNNRLTTQSLPLSTIVDCFGFNPNETQVTFFNQGVDATPTNWWLESNTLFHPAFRVPTTLGFVYSGSSKRYLTEQAIPGVVAKLIRQSRLSLAGLLHVAQPLRDGPNTYRHFNEVYNQAYSNPFNLFELSDDVRIQIINDLHPLARLMYELHIPENVFYRLSTHNLCALYRWMNAIDEADLPLTDLGTLDLPVRVELLQIWLSEENLINKTHMPPAIRSVLLGNPCVMAQLLNQTPLPPAVVRQPLPSSPSPLDYGDVPAPLFALDECILQEVTNECMQQETKLTPDQLLRIEELEECMQQETELTPEQLLKIEELVHDIAHLAGEKSFHKITPDGYTVKSKDKKIASLINPLVQHINDFLKTKNREAFKNSCHATLSSHEYHALKKPHTFLEKMHHALVCLFRAFFRMFDLGWMVGAKTMAETQTPFAKRLTGRDHFFEPAKTSSLGKRAAALSEHFSSVMEELTPSMGTP
jgi:hypothetical protein